MCWADTAMFPDLHVLLKERKKRRVLGDYLLDKKAIKELLSALEKSYQDMYNARKIQERLN